MNARLDNRVTEPDRVVTTLVVVAAALYLGFAGWLTRRLQVSRHDPRRLLQHPSRPSRRPG
jgi:hypothetical protein